MAVRDYSSIYTIQEFFLNEVAPKYFKLEDISLYNVGLYGMITDIIGTTTEDSFNVTSRYINEIMPARAELPDFIYSNAALYGVTDILASPAKMPFVIHVREKDVVSNGVWTNNIHTFEIDSSTIIYVDDMPYALPHNVVITSTLFRGCYTHRAYYREEFTNNLYKKNNPYLKLFKTTIAGESWIGIRVDIYQYARIPSTEPIITNSILNIPYVNVSYSNQLCNFEVLYKPFGKSTYTQLEKRMETMVPTTTPFVYYKIIDDSTIRLSFANDDRYFVPGYNSSLLIYTYETQGTAGNFKYNEDVSISIVSDDPPESLAYNRNISFFGLMKSDSEGGRPQLDRETIKRLYLEKMISINSYTTDTDLNLHYLNFAEIYNNGAIFIKYRDDYANREYGCFTRFTDGSDIYPTNTLDLRLGVDQVDNHFVALRQYIVKPGKRYGYPSDSVRDVIVPLSDSDDVRDIEYTTFALMIITVRPNFVKYYMNSVNKLIDLDYSYMNTKSILNFLVGECSIKRNAIMGEDEYTINISITRVDGVTSVIGDNDELSNFKLDPTKLKVLMVFNTSEGHYFEMVCINDFSDEKEEEFQTFNFQAVLKTNDMIDDERISILNLCNRISGKEEERIIQMYNTDVKFCVFYDYSNPELNSGHEYSDIPLITGYSLCNEYTPIEDEFYFAYPLTLIRSHVIFEENLESNDGWNFYIKQVPLFGKDFLLGLKDTSDVLNSIISQHKFLTDTMEDITANFTINLKFYNTYGRSRLFYLGVNQDTNKTLLNFVNCELNLLIKFYDGVIVENYLSSIKIYIKKYLEGLNMDNDGSNRLHISVLIQKLHNEFDCIELIIFEGLNNYPPDVQNVQLKSLLNTLVDPNTVPEFLTIKEDNIHITTVTSL